METAKERIIEVAESLMLERGYNATSLEQICRGASLTKGSFFHYFDSKEELAKNLIERFAALILMRIESGDYKNATDPVERLFGMVDHMIQHAQDKEVIRGCLIGIFGQELAVSLPQFRPLLAKSFGRWSQLVEDLLDEAKAADSGAVNFSSRDVAEYFISLIEGSLVLIRSTKNTLLLKKNLLQFRTYLSGLFSRQTAIAVRL